MARLDGSGPAAGALAAGMLLGSYLWLAAAHGSLALGPVLVYESGRLTFAETVLSWDHFLREIPLCVVMALAVVAVHRSTGRRFGAPPAVRTRVAVVAAAAVCALLPIAAFATTAGERGADHALRDLLQFRTRGDVESFGSHWHSHWFHAVWFCVAGPVAAAALRRGGPPTAGIGVWVPSWALTAALTAVFGLPADVFTGARVVAHQAREIATHTLLTAPIAWWALEAARGAADRAPDRVPATGAAPASPGPENPSRRRTLAAGAASAAVVVHLGVRTLGIDIAAEGQMAGGVAGLVAAHVFEHSLDYVWVASLCVVLAACRR